MWGTVSLVIALIVSSGVAYGQCVITGDTTLDCEGTVYRTVDDRGVYYIDLDAFQGAHPGVPLPEIRRTLSDNYGPRADLTPILVELTDYIDCTRTDHNYSHGDVFDCGYPINKSSRLLTIGDRVFRVTAAPDEGFITYHYSYDFATGGAAGVPHLLIAESVNDQERYTSITINAIDEYGWAPPYQGEPDINPWGDPWWEKNPIYTQQGPVFEPDVGLCTYTGREFPVTGERFNIYVLFYSKSSVMRVAVSSTGLNDPRGPNDGGAASRMWVFRVVDDLNTRNPEISTPPAPAEERRIGLYYPHSWYLYAHFGAPVRTLAHRQDGLENVCEYLRHCGFNWLEFNAINGSDRTDHAWYTGSIHFPTTPAGNLLTELPPIAEANGIGLLPVITSLKEPRAYDGITWTGLSFQLGNDGDWTQAFGNPLPDPLRPEVQELVGRLIDEIGTRIASQPSVKGIGIRVNGKIGLCYTSDQDGWRGARLSGYSSWDLQEFKNDTGSGVPTSPPGTAYSWLRARPTEWEAWISWRCSRMRDFWLAMRDRVKSHRPDLDLFIKCVLPSETPGTNIEWVSTPAIELLREAGYDPSLYVGDTGIYIQRGMMVAEDRFYTRGRWLDPWGTNSQNYKAFHYAAGLPESYVTGEGRACELYHNYIEEVKNQFWEFGAPCDPYVAWFRTTTPGAWGRNFFEPLAMSMRRQNPDTFTLMGWNRASAGYEHALRSWCQAFRALPKGDPVPIDGTVSPSQSSVTANWYANRLAVINDANTTRTITLNFNDPFPTGDELVEVASGKILLSTDQVERQSLSFQAEPWSLSTFLFTSGQPSPTPTATATETPLLPTSTPTQTAAHPTSTPTVTPVPLTATPTPTSDPSDPIFNPSFEVDDTDFVNPPAGWSVWHVNETLNGTLGANSWAELPLTIPDGDYCAGKVTNWGFPHGGFYQTVNVMPSREYECSVYVHTPPADSSGEGQARLGVDLSGGTDPALPSIQWTPWTSSTDHWQEIGFKLTTTGNTLTLFLELEQDTASGWNAMLFDMARVRLVEDSLPAFWGY